MGYYRRFPRPTPERGRWRKRRPSGSGVKAALTALTAEQVAEFAERFYFFKAKAYHWDLWAAAYLIGGGCSDDAFMDFRNGLIASGREVYEAALANADSLADVVVPDDERFSFESFDCGIRDVYRKKTGQYLPLSHADTENPAGEPWYDKDEDAGEENLTLRLPRLSALFGDQ